MKKKLSESDHIHHISRLKRHRNVLYGVVVVLLLLQIISFVFISSQVTKTNTQQEIIAGNLENYVSELQNTIGEARQESQFNINEISRELAQQKKDVQGEIALLKSSQADFSGIIGDTVEGVVNVRTDVSGGTGFILNSEGYIVTNLHVIQSGHFVQVQTFDGTIYDAVAIGGDPVTDIALLKAEGSFEYLELEDSDNIDVGEKVIAIGNPLGLSFTVTEGIVSAIDRVGPNGLPNYIQSDVDLNPGNSGGPLINKRGKVIGINNFKVGGAEGLGFALESDVVKVKINEIAGMMLLE